MAHSRTTQKQPAVPTKHAAAASRQQTQNHGFLLQAVLGSLHEFFVSELFGFQTSAQSLFLVLLVVAKGTLKVVGF